MKFRGARLVLHHHRGEQSTAMLSETWTQLSGEEKESSLSPKPYFKFKGIMKTSMVIA